MIETEYTSVFYDLQATEILTDVWKSRIITDVADTNNDENERDTDPEPQPSLTFRTAIQHLQQLKQLGLHHNMQLVLKFRQ